MDERAILWRITHNPNDRRRFVAADDRRGRNGARLRGVERPALTWHKIPTIPALPGVISTVMSSSVARCTICT